MQIILDENEIQDALNTYCEKIVDVPVGKKIKVEFIVGRGGNGTRATIDFEDTGNSEFIKETMVACKGKEPKKEVPTPTLKEESDIIERPGSSDKGCCISTEKVNCDTEGGPKCNNEETKDPVEEKPVTNSDSLFNF